MLRVCVCVCVNWKGKGNKDVESMPVFTSNTRQKKSDERVYSAPRALRTNSAASTMSRYS